MHPTVTLLRLHLLLMVFAACQARPLSAQESADSLAAIALPRVDVTDSSRLLRADAPARLSRAHVALTATWTLASALNAAPGVFIQQGALNTNRLSIRGVGSRIPFATGKVRAYLDEIPLTDGAGITTFEDIDPQWIDHIEVSKGPQSAALGPTLGGALRLRTAAPAVEGTRQVASLRVGSFGTAGAGLMASRAQGGRSSLWGGSLLHSDGYRDNSTYDRAQLLWLGKRLDARAEHSTLVLGTLMKAHISSSLDATDFAERPWAAAASWAAVSGYEAHRKLLWGHTFRRVKEDRVALIALFGQIRDSWEVRPFNVLSENVWNGGMRFRLEGGRAHPWTWRLGGEAMAEDYGWQTFAQVAAQPGALLSHNRERRAYAQLFADGRWQRADGRWEVAAGLGVAAARFAYSDLFFGDSLDHSATKAFAPVWSPRVQAGWRAGRALWLLGRLSHGIGWPGVEDSRRADGTINPAIRPEQGWNAELGARGALGTLASFELVVYQMEIRDLLVARRVGPDIYEGVNAGRTRHRGLELDLRTAAWRGLRLEGSLHLSDYRFVDFVDGTADYSGNRLTGWPEHTARLWLMWEHRSWSAVLRHERTGRMPLRDDNSAWSAPYALWHLRVEYQRPFGKWHLRLFAEGRNLTDAHYASMILVNATSFGGSQPRYYYPGPPRHFNLGVRVQGGVSRKGGDDGMPVEGL